MKIPTTTLAASTLSLPTVEDFDKYHVHRKGGMIEGALALADHS